MRQSREKYQQWMEKGSKKKEHKLRKFQKGEEVLLYKPIDSKRLSKISAAQRGPYRITKVHGNGVSYDIKLIGSNNKRGSLQGACRQDKENYEDGTQWSCRLRQEHRKQSQRKDRVRSGTDQRAKESQRSDAVPDQMEEIHRTHMGT